ncbi:MULTISPECIES: potassium transporter Kup [Nitrospirillum]|uniref:Probable potassium transport system protein Kup n=2 Tax=Nitrospirillum TaxID=1543705 RepID=A0A248JZ38_9PROT|nr:potassium transporter Kup [Nitrospirillum amazonense]ASG23829.1 potassium transporter Kup [Nitrospirillum amazonense CBAmc]MEC4594751.1 potassium transporter Kup [Nitrospirillum amazonense]TWB28462.1 KUP system potassium uptake protein [Nitrospirillum amazonense]TWB44753.1 KUP system potassium uptake protein [Nitrospirillum amazonense]
MQSSHSSDQHDAGRRHWALTLGALGVVYGDIGTSPLYTMHTAFDPAITGMPLNEANIFGFLSMVVWSLVLVVTLKYVVLILRADNKGEGGILSLSTLALSGKDRSRSQRRLMTVLAMLGLALFYGDGMITPAVSVLSAVEGLEISAPDVQHWVVPITVVILVGLFLIQSGGTNTVGRLFGPVMCFWFACLGAMGVVHILQVPHVLKALDPRYALDLAFNHGWSVFYILGAAVLSFTGGEALYADMGHFGRRPIRHAWVAVVFPALVLNYFGQGALLLSKPEAIDNPFFLLVPEFLLLPLVVLSTAATIIASQAVISGVFSLTRQAVQLGYMPRMEIRHTSESEIGQVYVPRINWALLVAVVALVIMFGSSAKLTDAYGLAVTGSMAITTIMALFTARDVWGWSRPRAAIVFGFFLFIDFSFLTANCLKIPQGGWLPLTVGLGVFVLVSTWRLGRKVLYDRIYRDALPMSLFLERADRTPVRVAGTAVFMTGSVDKVPHALLHNLKHNKVLHERVVLMRVLTEEVPWVTRERRVSMEKLGKGFFSVTAHFGFMEQPNVPRALAECRPLGLAIDLAETSFFLGRETLVPSSRSDLTRWQEQVFIALSATALSATTFFDIPPNRVVELGTQVEV